MPSVVVSEITVQKCEEPVRTNTEAVDKSEYQEHSQRNRTGLESTTNRRRQRPYKDRLLPAQRLGSPGSKHCSDH